MKIGIIAAMSKELALLIPLIEDHVSHGNYHSGRIGEHEIVAMQSGIGKVNAAMTAMTMIRCFGPDLIINTGVAGGVGRTRPLDVVIPACVAYHDVWCGPGTVYGEADGCPLRIPCRPIQGTPQSGLLASGDIFISRPEEVRHIMELYPDAVAVDMESAAIAQVCYKNNTEFSCIRVVSDTPGADDNIAQYESFWDDAPRATFAALTEILSEI